MGPLGLDALVVLAEDLAGGLVGGERGVGWRGEGGLTDFAIGRRRGGGGGCGFGCK